VVGLLSVGSKAKPKELLGRGEEGAKQLVEVRKEGERGVGAYLQKEGKERVGGVLGEGGMPVWPSAMGRGKGYVMDQDRAEGYPEE